MISGRLGFVASLLGLGLTAQGTASGARRPDQGSGLIDAQEARAEASHHHPQSRHRLRSLLKPFSR
jgi:hypothetical protein